MHQRVRLGIPMLMKWSLALASWSFTLLLNVSFTDAAESLDEPMTAPTASEPPAPPDAPTTPPAEPAKAVEPPAPEPPVAGSQKGLPRLRIEANRPGVRLLRIERVMSDDMGEGMLVKNVCTAPCNQVIDGRARQTFFFGADGMVPSRGFRLSRLEGDILARVNGGSLAARQIGYLLGGFGGAAVIGGATMLGVGYTRNDGHLSNEGKVVEGPNPYLTTGGFVVLGVGAAMVTTAVILVVTAKTKITLLQAENKSPRITLEAGVLRF